jgi:hypothetical protein
MKLVRTSVVVASVFCASLAWSAESHAQSSGSTDDQAQHDKKTTKKTTKNTKDTSAPASSSSSSTQSGTTSGSTVTDTTTQSGSGSGTTGSGTTGSSSDTMSGTGQTTGTGSDASPTTGSMTGTGTGGTQPYDQSGTTYPLGTQPMPNQGAYGQQNTYGQPATTPSTTTSTTTTTAANYDPTVTADTEGGKYKIRPNRPMLITGSAIFLGSYAATAIQGAVSDLDADRKNLIPVAGPWINMSERPCNLSDNCSTGENVNNVLLIGSGVAQGAGIAIAIASLFVPETKERSDMAKAAPPKPEFRFMPGQMGRGGAGAFAVGSF